MSELDPLSINHPNWDRHFDDFDGGIYVATREKVYYLPVKDGSKPPNLTAEQYQAARHAGVPADATLAIAGSGGAVKDEERIISMGHNGNIYSCDKNPQQFLRLVELGKFEEKSTEADYGIIRGTPRLWGGIGMLTLVRLFEADAADIPLPDNSIDLGLINLALQNMDPRARTRALLQYVRMLKTADEYSQEDTQKSGILSTMNSAEKNKETIHDMEPEVAALLTKLCGRKIDHPSPLQAGFPAEESRRIFPIYFDFSYAKVIKRTLEVRTIDNLKVIIAAMLTLAPDYRDSTGKSVDFDLVSFVITEVAISRFEEAIRQGSIMTETMEREITFSSNVELPLPPDYKPMARPAG